MNYTRMVYRCLAVAVFAALVLQLFGRGGTQAPTRYDSAYGKLPLAFEPNRGQADGAVRFLARGSGYSLLLGDNEAVLKLAGGKAVVRLEWIGARPHARAAGQDQLPGVSNYLLGNDPAKWRTDIPQFAQVRFSGVYPGIDLVYYGQQRKLEYDAILAPHADPRQLRLRILGAERIRISPEGDLVLSVPGGEIFQRKPLLYQMDGRNRRQIEGRYELRASGEVGFAVDSYDAGKPLVIDPVLSYSTYLGGTGSDNANALAVDGNGNAYVTGDTTSTDFPTLGSPILQSARRGTTDAFVAKLNAAGTALLYSTYLGGTRSQTGRAIAVDSNGAAYVAGYTNSSDFPHTAGAFQTGGPSSSSSEVGFVSKLNATGSGLTYSTFIGAGSGNNSTYANAIAVDGAGSAYVAGATGDWGIPMSATAIQRQVKGSTDAFVIKLNAAGTGEVYGTYFGGAQDDGANGIAVDSHGNAFIAGYTDSSDLPTRNPIQASNQSPGLNLYGNSGFVAELNGDASALVYSTYLGGVNITRANAIALDGNGNAYVTGVIYPPSSGSDTFPLQNPLQPAPGGGSTDAFLTQIDAAGTALVYSTYLGGSGDDSGSAVAVDGAGNAFVTGRTTSYDFPVVNEIQPNPGSAYQVVLKSLDGGTTWIAGMADEPTGPVNALAVNPVSPSTMYAGTATGRVFQSVDGGAHWSRSDSGLPGAAISSLAIGASNTATLYAGTAAGVFKSTNGGITWSAQNSGLSNLAVVAVAVDPSSSDIVYAVTSGSTGGAILLSVDGGGAWTPVVTGNHRYFTSLVIHPLKPQYVYAGASDGNIVYSFDRFATGPQVFSPNSNVSRVNALAIDPVADQLYAAVNTKPLPPYYPDIRVCSGSTSLTYGWGANYSYGGGPGISVAVSSSGSAYVGTYGFIQGAANTGSFTGPFWTVAADPFAASTLYIGNSGTGSDAFLTVVNPAGTAMVSSGYFGGSGSDEGRALAVDTNGNAWLAGVTASPDFPATAGVRQTVNAGGTDAFVAKIRFVADSAPPAAAVLVAPANAAPSVGLAPTLTWNAAANATSYDVYFGTASTPPQVSNTIDTSYSPPLLSPGATYYWTVGARNGAGATVSGTWSFSTPCAPPLTVSGVPFSAAAGMGSIPVSAPASCAWTAQSNALWLTVTSGTPGNGSGQVNYSVSANAGPERAGTLTVAGQTFTVTQAQSPLQSRNYLVSPLAGGTVPATAIAGTSASVLQGYGIAADLSGNVYFPMSNALFKVDSHGVLMRVAGTGVGGFSGDNGPALSAQLSNAQSVAVDAAGNLYIADSYSNRIRKVTPQSIITTIAGGDWTNPQGVAVDAAGNNVYVADSYAGRVLRVDTAGTITVFAGTGSWGYSGDGAAATNAQLSYVNGMALDAAGDVYIADTMNQVIRMVDTTGKITTVAGSGESGYGGDGLAATAAKLNDPQGVAVDVNGNLYIADSSNNRVRKVDIHGTITTVAGSGYPGFSGDGFAATGAQLSSPYGVAVDGTGNLYITDSFNARVRRVSAAGIISTVVGGGVGDGGPGVFAQVNQPAGVARDSSGNVYVADTYNHRVRKIAPSGAIATVAGTGVSGYAGDGTAATGAQLNSPYGVAVDSAGSLYIADSGNNRIRRVDTNGKIASVAGSSASGYGGDGGAATGANLNYPEGVAVDGAGNLYIADTRNHRVRKMDTSGKIATVAGTGTPDFSGDTLAATGAQLNSPSGVAVDSTGNLYIADSNNNRIRKVDAAGTITTVAGNGNSCCGNDGVAATSSPISSPRGVAVDTAGNLYIAESSVRKVMNGIIGTIAWNMNPSGLAVDPSGPVYVAYAGDSVIRMLTPVEAQPVLTIQSAHSGGFAQGQSDATFTLTVSNTPSASPTSGTVTVTEILPAGFTLGSMSGSGWNCTANVCTCGDMLPDGWSYSPITVKARVSYTAPEQVTNQATVSVGGGFPAGSGDLAAVQATVMPVVLTIAAAHTGSFAQGQIGATYSVTVSNTPGAAPTSGTVTVSETVPPGMTLMSMSGTDWTCPAQQTTCWRSDILNSGESYPPITVTVNVGAGAVSPATNQAGVSWGVSASATASDLTNISPLACNVSGDVSASVSDVQLIVDQALGAIASVDDMNHDGAINVVDVQIVMNAALQSGCTMK